MDIRGSRAIYPLVKDKENKAPVGESHGVQVISPFSLGGPVYVSYQPGDVEQYPEHGP